MLCDGNPDPLNTRELNTYMNLWRGDKEYKSIPVVLSESEGTLKVFEIQDINFNSNVDNYEGYFQKTTVTTTTTTTTENTTPAD